MPNLQRFIDAQKNNYAQAKSEIKAGRKVGHWIWYIVPQMKALGFSDNAKFYGIEDFDEACEYLRNPILFERYYEMVHIINQQLSKKPPLHLIQLMGAKVDAVKLVSSLTLFRGAAAYLELHQGESNHNFKDLKNVCDKIYTTIAKQHFSSCQSTLIHLPSGLELQKINPSVDTQTIITYKPIDISTPEHKKSKGNDTVRTSIRSPIIPKLEYYIQERTNEWSFHYNFLGIVALIYLIQDAVLGTNHFNSKSRDTKISSAIKLKHMLDPGFHGQIEALTIAEETALQEGRLGKLVDDHGGLQQLLTHASVQQFDESTGFELK
jgi:uncharacterized protein (DUF1810 family)